VGLGLWLAACATTSGTPVAERTPNGPPLEMALVDADGEPLHLGELRGQPLLIYVFTTFDEVCQLALLPLSQAPARHPELQLLGIAAQPDPQRLLPLYRDALAVEFPLTYDPEQRVVVGDSPLGPLDTVPAYFVLDADGRVVARHVGALDGAELDELLSALPAE
jgi:peroxiredoxin